MDIDCNDNGLSYKEGMCMCSEEYAGLTCESCEDGYNLVSVEDGEDAYVCVPGWGKVISGSLRWVGLSLSFILMVVSIGWVVRKKFRKQEEDPFQRAFSWDSGKDMATTSLLDEDADAQLIDGTLDADTNGADDGVFGLQGDDDDDSLL